MKETALVIFGIAILVMAPIGFYLELRFWRFHKPSVPERILSYFVLMAIIAIALVLVFARDFRAIARGYIILMPVIIIGAVGVAIIRFFVVLRYIREARQQRELILKDIARILARKHQEEKPDNDRLIS